MKTIAVGTRNPAKIEAVQRAVARIWPEAEVISVDVPSGVSRQPLTDEEAIRGAMNRASRCRESADADLGIGLEGCTVDTDRGMFLSGWVAASDRSGAVGLGSGGRLLLPDSIADEVRSGRELGPVMDGVAGMENTKQGEGAVGILTGGLVPRADAFERSVLFALSRFLRLELYE